MNLIPCPSVVFLLLLCTLTLKAGPSREAWEWQSSLWPQALASAAGESQDRSPMADSRNQASPTPAGPGIPAPIAEQDDKAGGQIEVDGSSRGSATRAAPVTTNASTAILYIRS
ncbi:MAG: hypothetical protein JNK15_07660, partial [Planctomycetes bacterium]|nr:hypothetical protein [Planctomycetota bacterium]